MIVNSDKNPPIRVLHMIGNLNIGGSQAFIMNVYKKIDREKIQFDFVVDHPSMLQLVPAIQELGGKVYTLPGFRGFNYIEVIRSWNVFFNEHPEYKVIHSHVRSYASLYLPIAKRRGLTTIIHSHSTSNGPGISALYKSILQYPLRFLADYYFACSLDAGKWLFGKRLITQKNFRILNNGIDVNKYKFNKEVRDITREKLNISNEFVIGHVGRFTAAKNHVFILKVFLKYLDFCPSSILLLVGDGELYPNIKQKVAELGMNNRVKFIGATDEAHEYYQAMDCFLFPSLWEGLGISIIEAVCSGLPCIISDSLASELNICDNIIRLPISDDRYVNKWIDKIKEVTHLARKDQSELVSRSGFDIANTAKYLENLYLNSHYSQIEKK